MEGAKPLKRVTPKLGDVFAIPLSKHRYVAGRLYEDCAIGIFGKVFRTVPELARLEGLKPSFFISCFRQPMIHGSWPRIGTLPFADGEEKWGPPRYIQDVLAPTRYSIYQRGEMREATLEQVRGLYPTVLHYEKEALLEIKRRLSILRTGVPDPKRHP